MPSPSIALDPGRDSLHWNHPSRRRKLCERFLVHSRWLFSDDPIYMPDADADANPWCVAWLVSPAACMRGHLYFVKKVRKQQDYHLASSKCQSMTVSGWLLPRIQHASSTDYRLQNTPKICFRFVVMKFMRSRYTNWYVNESHVHQWIPTTKPYQCGHVTFCFTDAKICPTHVVLCCIRRDRMPFYEDTDIKEKERSVPSALTFNMERSEQLIDTGFSQPWASEQLDWLASSVSVQPSI